MLNLTGDHMTITGNDAVCTHSHRAHTRNNDTPIKRETIAHAPLEVVPRSVATFH